MFFIQQLGAAFIGFIFALFLFYFTEYRKNRKERHLIRKYYQRELKANISKLEDWKEEAENILSKIPTEALLIIPDLRYKDLCRIAIDRAYLSGYLYDNLKDEQISSLNGFVSHFTPAREELLLRYATEWNNKKIKAEDVQILFNYEKEQIVKHLKFLQSLSKLDHTS